MTAAMMVSILASVKKPLSELVDTLPKRFIIKDKITTPHGERILGDIITAYSHDSTDYTDGVKILRANSWALVRASGTEPILRIIVDAENKNIGIAFHKELKDRILTLLQMLDT
jgi:phosphomannomutase/phosphoglucomutase